MPSAANGKSEKPASSEASDNSPIRQIITIIEHKIRNLEKRKSKLTSYRDLQKAGKELNADQKTAVAKYDEVAQTLEFARDLSKQVATIATASEREAKKQAKREAWVRYASETTKIREVLLILDCLVQMGNSEARDDFLNGTNGAAKLTEADLKILDDLYPEVTPKHEPNEDGHPGFHQNTAKAAEHLYAIIDGKPKEILGTTYAHIKEIVSTVYECGYFDKVTESVTETDEIQMVNEECDAQEIEQPAEVVTAPTYPPPGVLPVPPAPAVVPTPAYPLRPLPPITLQEVEHAYFSQQYPQQRPISEVIGSQNFFFLQESEIDSPVGTPQPPPILNQPSPPAPIPTQTFTNQHLGMALAQPQPHFAPHPHPHPHPHAHPEQLEHAPAPAPFAAVPLALPAGAAAAPAVPLPAAPAPAPPLPVPPSQPVHQPAVDPHYRASDEQKVISADDKNDDEWKESGSPEREDTGDRKTQGQGDGQNRFRRYGRGGGRGSSNGYRGRGGFQNRQNSNESYHGRHGGEFQGRQNKDNYQNRYSNDGYQNRHGKDNYQTRGNNNNDGYFGNGDAGDNHQHNENGGRDRYDNNQSYQGGFKSRGRGGPRGGPRGAPRTSRPQQYNRKQENID